MGVFNIDGKFYTADTYTQARAMAAAEKTGGSPPKIGAPPPIVAATKVVAPTQVTSNVVVTPPPVVKSPTTLTTPSVGVRDGEINVVHRADGRAVDHASIKRDKGFACQNGQWCIREVACARAFIRKIIDPSYDTSSISGFTFANEILTPARGNFNLPGKKAIKQKDLNDVMIYIKRVLKDTRAFWVSTSLNKECGGYATNDAYNLYRFTLPKTLKQYELILGEPLNTLRPVSFRSNDMVPTLCFDGAAPDGSDSNIVAINSGPVDDCEISFLTRIPLAWVELLRAQTA